MDDKTITLMLRSLAGDGEAAAQPDVVDALRHIPVAQRALLAAVALAAADRPVNSVTVARSAGYSRGTAYRNNKPILDLVVKHAGQLADGLLHRARDHRSILELSTRIKERDEALTRWRDRAKQAERDRDIAIGYARDLHQQLIPEYKAIVSEKDRKVRHLRSTAPPDETEVSPL